MLKWLWLSVLVVVLDQVSKALASAHLHYHQPVDVLPMFNLTLSYNTGAAFSFLGDAGGWQRWLFVGLAVVVSVVLVLWLKRLTRREVWIASSLALIVGGAVGNVIDRVRLGYVVDFLDVYYRSWHWPTFNIADSAITVGVTILILDGLLGRSSSRTE
ncbi:MAG: signal peptidase II [Gammaproteobacteria bacterium]|jgi:signal peptidase II